MRESWGVSLMMARFRVVIDMFVVLWLVSGSVVLSLRYIAVESIGVGGVLVSFVGVLASFVFAAVFFWIRAGSWSVSN